MAKKTPKPAADQPPDQDSRDRIVRERAANVVADAGAGTGKTKTLVDRVLELVAPRNADHEPLELSRIAAITFTRRAAGELRFRIREELLREIAKTGLASARHAQLMAALSQLDTAFVGTIHSFADRLLRMRPIEAGISPQYEVAEDTASLTAKVTELLTTGAQGGTLAELLAQPLQAGHVTAARVEEAQQTLEDYITAGLQLETAEVSEFFSRVGIDSFFAEVIDHRDRRVELPEVPPLDMAACRVAVESLIDQIDEFTGDNEGLRYLRDLQRRLNEVENLDDPVIALAALQRAVFPLNKDLQKRKHFDNDDEGWTLYRDDVKGADGNLLQHIITPLHQWLGARLVRMVPVVLAAYEQVKAEHEVVDQTDLLIKLAQMLRDPSSGTRQFYQGLFDHILVDEFQDTDPLQAEILFYLCERGVKASDWREVELTPGKLTIVGDPKQSIFRFRRADIITYAAARRLLIEQGAVDERLETNFRSRPGLIRFFNDKLEALLGTPPEADQVLDDTNGKAYYEPLESWEEIEDIKPVVHMVPYAGPGAADLSAADGRPVEAAAMARYVRWLIERSGVQVRDPISDELRPVRYADVAVLAAVTTNLPMLFDQFELLCVPYAARGGKLYLEQPVVRQLILGLRAIADVSDGVAQAVLYRPPFFALDLADVAAGNLEDPQAHGAAVEEAAQRYAEAREQISEFRKTRFNGLPSATARKLMEQTAFERTVTLLPNGAQIAAAAREILTVMDRMTIEQGLDFDGVTAKLREWIDSPIQLDPPSSTENAVHIMTIHQAKGLEFPVVLIWDGFAGRSGRGSGSAWTIADQGNEWGINLNNFTAESANASQFVQIEKAIQKSERERLYYVAATRARDLLVLPVPQVSRGGQILSSLWQDDDDDLVTRLEAFQPDQAPDWAAEIEPAPFFPEIAVDPDAADQHATRTAHWQQQRDLAAKPIAVPVAVTTLAHGPQPADDGVAAAVADITEDAADQPQRLDAGAEAEDRQTSRFGPKFGDTVHRALALILGGETAPAEQVVRACAQYYRLDDHVDEAVADVQRALQALDQAGFQGNGVTLYPEYPITLLEDEGQLIVGYIDLLVVSDNKVTIIDFKTDQPPAVSVDQTYPQYKRQVKIYADVVGKILTKSVPVEARLLFTANGQFEICA